MHRHGYKGRKFHRETDQRSSMLKSLMESIIIHEGITTTLPKAKEIRPELEKLITTAKLNTLASRRTVISKLHTKSSAHKLVDEIVPKLKSRNSGYLRIKRQELRRGDNAQLASISFIFDQAKENKPVSEIDKSKEDVVPKQKVEKSSTPKLNTKDKPTAKKSPKKEVKKWKLSQ